MFLLGSSELFEVSLAEIDKLVVEARSTFRRCRGGKAFFFTFQGFRF